MKKILRKLVYKHRSSSASYVRYLRKIGVDIGNDVEIFNPKTTIIDEQYPWMIKIGDHVKITDGVIILTHDFSWSVIKNYKKKGGGLLGASGRVTIGNNVFIGMNSIITRNVHIGDDVIIGVGSIVTSDCDSGYVYVGVPARKLMSIEDYIRKREKLQLKEAKELAISYMERFKTDPPLEIFHEYFLLFMTVEEANKVRGGVFEKQLHVGGSFKQTIEFYKNIDPMFSSFDEFIRYCKT